MLLILKGGIMAKTSVGILLFASIVYAVENSAVDSTPFELDTTA